METTINIKVKLSTLKEITKEELDKIQIDASQVTLLPYDIIERKIEEKK